MLSFDLLEETFYEARDNVIYVKQNEISYEIKLPVIAQKLRVGQGKILYILSGNTLYRKSGSEFEPIENEVVDFNLNAERLIVLFRNGMIKDYLDNRIYRTGLEAQRICRSKSKIFLSVDKTLYSLDRINGVITELFKLSEQVKQIECTADQRLVILTEKFIYIYDSRTSIFSRYAVSRFVAGPGNYRISIRARVNRILVFNGKKIFQIRETPPPIKKVTVHLKNVINEVPYKLTKAGPIFEGLLKVWARSENEKWKPLEENNYEVDYSHAIIRFHSDFPEVKICFVKPGFTIKNIYTSPPLQERDNLLVNGYYGVSVIIGRTFGGIYQPFSFTVKGTLGNVKIWGSFENPEAGPTPVTALYRKYLTIESRSIFASFGDIYGAGKIVTGMKMGYRGKATETYAFAGTAKENIKHIIMTLKEHEISLSPYLPSPGSIKIYINGRKLVEGEDFIYIEETNQISLSPAIELSPPPIIYIEFKEETEESNNWNAGYHFRSNLGRDGALDGTILYQWKDNITYLNLTEPSYYYLRISKWGVEFSATPQVISGGARFKFGYVTSTISEDAQRFSGELWPSYKGFGVKMSGKAKLTETSKEGEASSLLGHKIFMIGGGARFSEGSPPQDRWLEADISIPTRKFKWKSRTKWFIEEGKTESRIQMYLKTRMVSLSSTSFVSTPDFTLSSSGILSGTVSATWFFKRDQENRNWGRLNLSLSPYGSVSYIQGSQPEFTSLNGEFQVPLHRFRGSHTLYFLYKHLYYRDTNSTRLSRENVLKLSGIPWSIYAGVGTSEDIIYPILGASYYSSFLRLSYEYSNEPVYSGGTTYDTTWKHHFDGGIYFKLLGNVMLQTSLDIMKDSVINSYMVTFRKKGFSLESRGVYQMGVENCYSFSFSARMYL